MLRRAAWCCEALLGAALIGTGLISVVRQRHVCRNLFWRRRSSAGALRDDPSLYRLYVTAWKQGNIKRIKNLRVLFSAYNTILKRTCNKPPWLTEPDKSNLLSTLTVNFGSTRGHWAYWIDGECPALRCVNSLMR